MNELEAIMSRYDEFEFIFKKDMPPKLYGYIDNETIYINDNISYEDKVATVMEEVGHYYMTIGDIVDYSDMKEEYKARLWSYEQLISIDRLKKYQMSNEPVHDYEIAEDFGLPVNVIVDAIRMFFIKDMI